MKATKVMVAKRYAVRALIGSVFVLVMGAASLPSCVVRTDWPRHEVRVVLRASLEESTRALHHDEQLWVVFDAVELVACDATSPTAQLTSSLFISEALAHGPTTPIRQGTPHVIDLFAPMLDTLATFEPPPGDYCELKISFGPADDDAFGLEPSNLGVIDHSVMWHIPDVEGPHAMSTVKHDRTFVFDEPWHFGTTHDQHATLPVQIDLNALLDAIEPETARGADQIGRDILTYLPPCLLLEEYM